MHRRHCASECDERPVSGIVGRRAYRTGCPWLREFRNWRPAPSTSLGSQLFRHRRSIVAGCLLLAIANTLTTHGVRPTIIKDHLEAAADLSYDRWNSFSRITVSRNRMEPPAMFGPSPRTPDLAIQQRALNIDGGAGTAMYHFDGNLENFLASCAMT